MKIITLIFFATGLALFTNCKKSHNTTNHINCDGLITDTLGANDSATIYMPNAFTPNADGLNDASFPITKNISSIEFIIYDENNNIVFSTQQLGQKWIPSITVTTYEKYYYKIQAVTTSNHKIGECGELYEIHCVPANLSKSSLHFQDQLSPSGFTLATNEALPNCN